MAPNRNLGMARRPIPTDGAGNPVLYDSSNRPIRYYEGEDVAFVGREPGPGIPLRPYLPRGDHPRQWFPLSGENLNYIPRREAPDLTPFATLRNLADTSDIVRLAIEDVIQQVVALDWDVHPIDEKADAKTMRSRIDRVKKFLDRPDREHSFKRWLTMLLEDCLVIDALTFYRQRTITGEPYALVPIDGSTIKPIIDYYGRSPEPPIAAYQQVGVGRVETEFHRPYLTRQDLEAAIAKWTESMRTFGLDSPEERKDRVVEMVYAPRKPRAFTPYGQSPVERVVITVNLALRRQLHYLAFYTDGNIPEAFWKCPEKWEPSHIESMQDTFEKMLTGESGLRRRLRFMPGGVGAGLENPRGDDEWKKEFDEYLARIVCYAFNTSPLPLVQLMNRATGETSDAQETHSGSHPLMDFIAELITREVQEFFGEPDLEFIWTEDKERDERLFMEKSGIFVGRGIYTRNEVRDVEGREPLPGGDVATVDTASGPVPLADFVGGLEVAPEGKEEPGKNPLDVALPPAAGGGSALGTGTSPPASTGMAAVAAASALNVALPPAAKYNEAHEPAGSPEGGQFTSGEGGGGGESEEDEGGKEEGSIKNRKELTKSDRGRVDNWTAGDDVYQKMRDPNSDEGKELGKLLDRIPTFSGTVHRGMVVDKAGVDVLLAKDGEELTIKYNSSASRDKGVANEFAHTIQKPKDKWSVIMSVKTKGAAHVEKVAAMGYENEEEVILRAGTKYKVHVAKTVPAKRTAYVELEQIAG